LANVRAMRRRPREQLSRHRILVVSEGWAALKTVIECDSTAHAGDPPVRRETTINPVISRAALDATPRKNDKPIQGIGLLARKPGACWWRWSGRHDPPTWFKRASEACGSNASSSLLRSLVCGALPNEAHN
jgi:hypothetical protein